MEITWIKAVCRDGMGSAQCSYLVCDDDEDRWCAKSRPSLATVIEVRRRPDATMRLKALGDYCTGPPGYKITEKGTIQ